MVHQVIREEQAWDAVVTRTVGASAELLSVSRHIGDSRTYADGERVVKIRSAHVRPPVGVRSLAEEAAIIQRLGRRVRQWRDGSWDILELERVPGVPLEEVLDSLPVRARVAIVARVVPELRKLHALGVGHRDLRLDNVLVGTRRDPRLVDFDRAGIVGPFRAAMADWVGVGSGGTSANPFWKLLLFAVFPKAASIGRRVRGVFGGRGAARALPDDADLRLLEEGWALARGSGANAPGQRIAYYGFTYKGWHLPGERPWYLRWEAIRRAVSFEGKRVVELGSNLGLISSFALIHGAREAIGLDREPVIVEAARVAARAFKVTPDFRCADLARGNGWEREVGKADLVCALSLVHWLPDRTRVMRYLADAPEILYEGHDPYEVEVRMLEGLGFTAVSLLRQTERGRYLLHGRRAPKGG